MRKACKQIFEFDNGGRLFFALLFTMPLALYLPVRANHILASARGTVISIASYIIRDKQSKKSSKTLAREKYILSIIVHDNSTANGNPDGILTFEAMRDQVMTFIGAGHETTGTVWPGPCFYSQSILPHKRNCGGKIQEYMPCLFSDSREDESWLSKIEKDHLPYLNNVCRESLRYIPPVPFNR